MTVCSWSLVSPLPSPAAPLSCLTTEGQDFGAWGQLSLWYHMASALVRVTFLGHCQGSVWSV
jgi:hypothetical protein